jgi:heat shock protein HslJ
MRGARTFLGVGGVLALVAVGLVAATLALSTGGDDSANGSVPVHSVDQLAGSWRAVNDSSAPALVLGTVRLDFLDDGEVLAQTGCNSVGGPVSVADSVLVTGSLRSTLMACRPALTEQEQWITEMLESRPRLEQSGPYLFLHWGEGEQWWLGLELEPEGTSATIPAS